MSFKGFLLTGATGFLGGYLLRELLEQTDAPVYCLARSRANVTGERRLRDNLTFLFGKDCLPVLLSDRVIVLEGDVGQENFGLSPMEYSRLSLGVDGIFHAAAMLWHFGKMEEFENVNVQGVQRLLQFADTVKPKVLNHISTLAVSGRRIDNPDNIFRETDFHEYMEFPNSYVESKHKAERLLRPRLRPDGNVRVFRPGFLMGDSVSGKFKENILSDAQYLHLQGHILMRTAPPLYPDDYMDLTPVDYAAAAIVRIALQPDSAGGVYHICSPKPILKSAIWDCIRDYGYPARVVPPENYMKEALTGEDDLFMQGLQSVLVYLGDYEKSPAVFDTRQTLARLEGSGIRCPELDIALLHRYLKYCIHIGFLPSPEEIIRYEQSL
jgi:thioester reductase-like protein